MVARQIPADFAPEALKAQAILARTYIRKQMGGESEIPESALDLDFLEEEQLKSLWGTDKFVEYYRKIESAVEDTEGLVITWIRFFAGPVPERPEMGTRTIPIWFLRTAGEMWRQMDFSRLKCGQRKSLHPF